MAKKKKIKIVNRQEEMIKSVKTNFGYSLDQRIVFEEIYDVLIDIYSLIQGHKLNNEADGISDLGFALLYIEPWLDALKKELEEDTNYGEKKH